MLGSWKGVIKTVAVCAAIVAVVWLLWWYVDQIKSGRDAWWRGELARASTRISKAVAEKGDQVQLTDAELIEKLGESDADLRDAEARIKAEEAAADARRSQCPRIPKRCLRLDD